MAKLILTYLIFQTIYVVLNTLTSIFKIKSGKFIASLSSAICYAFYVYVLIFTMADFPDYIKATLTAITNFVGVYVSMFLLERFKKDKLWEITATTDREHLEEIREYLNLCKIPHNYNLIDNYDNTKIVFRIYSENQKQSIETKYILDKCKAKYIVHEESAKL